jgi:hypothetical protein
VGSSVPLEDLKAEYANLAKKTSKAGSLLKEMMFKVDENPNRASKAKQR